MRRTKKVEFVCWFWSEFSFVVEKARKIVPSKTKRQWHETSLNLLLLCVLASGNCSRMLQQVRLNVCSSCLYACCILIYHTVWFGWKAFSFIFDGPIWFEIRCRCLCHFYDGQAGIDVFRSSHTCMPAGMETMKLSAIYVWSESSLRSFLLKPDTRRPHGLIWKIIQV